MKKKISKTICLAVAALVLTVGLTVGTAMAYFTTYAVGNGGVTLDLGFAKTEIGDIDASVSEDQKSVVKPVTITNTSEHDCYVRIKVLAGNAVMEANENGFLYYEDTEGPGNWAPGTTDDGYYYYTEVLEAGESTSQLNVAVNVPADQDAFNVIIVQENTPVVLDANGKPYADWNSAANVSRTFTQ